MSRTEAQQRADVKYMQDKKRITLDLNMDTYDEIKDIASCRGESVTVFIRECILNELLSLSVIGEEFNNAKQ